MKLALTSDTHFAFTPDKFPEADVLLHAGDLMYTGYPDEWYARVDSLAALTQYKHKVLVPGNHDFHIQNYNGIARAELRRRGKTTLIDGGVREIEHEGDTYALLTIPFVTGLDGWAYDISELEMEDYLRKFGATTPDIVVSHGPMYQILDAINPDETTPKRRNEVGSWALRRWFDKLAIKPRLFVHGHIHESYGHVEVDGCQVYNVAMCDRDYEQTNPVVVVDV